MNRYKKNGRIIGFLLLSTCLTYIAGTAIISDILTATHPLTSVFKESRLFAGGILLVFSCAVGIAGIPLCLSPLISKKFRHLNLAYFGARLWEGGAITLYSIALMIMIPLSRKYSLQVADVMAEPEALVSFIAGFYRVINDVWIPLFLGMGGIFFNYILLRERFVPALFAIWGVIAYPLCLAGGLFEAFGISVGTWLAIPTAAYEFIFSVYLLIFGFADLNTKDKRRIA